MPHPRGPYQFWRRRVRRWSAAVGCRGPVGPLCTKRTDGDRQRWFRWPAPSPSEYCDPEALPSKQRTGARSIETRGISPRVQSPTIGSTVSSPCNQGSMQVGGPSTLSARWTGRGSAVFCRRHGENSTWFASRPVPKCLSGSPQEMTVEAESSTTKNSTNPSTSEVGRFLRKRRGCTDGPLGDRSLPRSRIGTSAGADNRTRRLIGLHRGFLLQTLHHRSSSEVGRFLRKRRVRRAGTPHRSDRRTGRKYGTLHIRQSRWAVPRGRTARRSVPTSEAF